MATIRCPAGHIFADIEDPNPNKYHILADNDFSKLAEAIIRTCDDIENNQVFIYSLISDHTKVMYKCPECGRLLIEKDPSQSDFTSYVNE
jgi:hypothetical protein